MCNKHEAHWKIVAFCEENLCSIFRSVADDVEVQRRLPFMKKLTKRALPYQCTAS